jgi:hypothetical protein
MAEFVERDMLDRDVAASPRGSRFAVDDLLPRQIGKAPQLLAVAT